MWNSLEHTPCRARSSVIDSLANSPFMPPMGQRYLRGTAWHSAWRRRVGCAMPWHAQAAPLSGAGSSLQLGFQRRFLRPPAARGAPTTQPLLKRWGTTEPFRRKERPPTPRHETNPSDAAGSSQLRQVHRGTSPPARRGQQPAGAPAPDAALEEPGAQHRPRCDEQQQPG
jgi:hypothetical protein